MARENPDWDRAFDLSGGVLCLDFANTVLRRNQPDRSKDELENYPRLLSFAKQTKLLSPAGAGLLRNRALQSFATVRRAISHSELASA